MANARINLRTGIATWTGGTGADALTGNDIYSFKIDGKGGDDILTGGLKNDSLVGGTGNDRLYGNDGADLLKGDAGMDILDGGNGSDILYGGIGNDVLFGGNGDDILFLENSGDILHGDEGTDVLNASTFKFASNEAGLNIDAGEGTYTVGIKATRTVPFHLSTVVGGTFDGIESFIGSTKNDTITAAATTTAIAGGAGDDVLNSDGNTGVLLQGDAGKDTLYGGNGDDTLIGGKDKDVLNGGAGNDVLTGDTGDTLNGGAGSDVINWSANLGKVDGGEHANGDVDVLSAINSTKGVTIDLEKEGTGKYGTLTGKKAFVARYDNIDKVIGSNFGDKLTASNAGTVLDGRGGDDTLTGGTGDDVFFFDAGYGKDVVKSAGNDDFVLLGDHLTFADVTIMQGTQKGQTNNLIIKTALNDTLTITDYFKTGGQKPYIIDSEGNVFDIAAAIASNSGKVVDDSGEKVINAEATATVQNSGALPGAVASMVSKTYEFTIGGDNLKVALGDHTNDTLKINAPEELFDYAKFLATDGSGISIKQSEHDLTLNFGTEQGTVTLEGYYADGAKNITKVELPTVFGIGSTVNGLKVASNDGGDLNGTASDDVLYGLGGNDIIDGKGGHNFMYGGAGNDQITASGSSMLVGGTGNDTLTGSDGSDVLVGGDGNDKLKGGLGRDLYVFGGTSWGDDVIEGESGTNYVAFVNKTMPNEDVFASVLDGHVKVTAGDSTIDLGTTAVAGDYRFVFGNPDANNSALYKIENGSFVATDTTANLHKDVFGKLF